MKFVSFVSRLFQCRSNQTEVIINKVSAHCQTKKFDSITYIFIIIIYIHILIYMYNSTTLQKHLYIQISNIN